MNVELIINGNGYLLTYTLPSGNMVEVRCVTPQLAVEYITDLEYRENKKGSPKSKRKASQGVPQQTAGKDLHGCGGAKACRTHGTNKKSSESLGMTAGKDLHGVSGILD